VSKINKNKILIIGSGSIANKHIENLIDLKIKNIFVLIKNDLEKKRFEKKNLSKIIFIKFREIDTWLSNQILFAIIANSTNNHHKYIKYLIKKKINIFCEKPISNQINLIRKLRKEIIQKKIIFFMNYQLREHNLVKKLKKLLVKEKVFNVSLKITHNLKYWRKNKIRTNSYYIDKKKGGGVIFELIHEVNLINFLFGKIDKISTFRKNLFLKRAEDQAASIFKTKKGVIGTLFQDMISPVKQRYIEVCSENKIFKLDFEENTLTLKTRLKKKIFRNYDDQNLSTLKKSLRKFIKLVKSKKFNITSFDEALYDLGVCKEMHK
tara:strand:- start:1217 stop:2182 length:966 start_codon:yes stop_codon:yes gene_type:complete